MKKINILLMAIFIIVLLMSEGVFAGGGKGGGSPAPRYFSFEDLRSGINSEIFFFENADKPTNAYVWLDTYLQYPLCASKNAVIAKKIAANPLQFKIDSMHLNAHWNDTVEINMDWDAISRSAGRGDLIFTRSNTKGGNFVKPISNWTHVAIVENALNKTVFESTPDTGVKVNHGPSTWKSIAYYTCKTVETIPYSYRCDLLNIGQSKYSGLPYYPKEETIIGRARFIFDWCNKDDMRSMYCSKLVYNVFKPNINLDSGRTCVLNSALQDKAWCGFVFSWIGVSPDDIYYSSSLGPDFTYSDNLRYL